MSKAVTIRSVASYPSEKALLLIPLPFKALNMDDLALKLEIEILKHIQSVDADYFKISTIVFSQIYIFRPGTLSMLS